MTNQPRGPAAPGQPDKRDISPMMVLTVRDAVIKGNWPLADLYLEAEENGRKPSWERNPDIPVGIDTHWYIDGNYGFSPSQRICDDDPETGECLGTAEWRKASATADIDWLFAVRAYGLDQANQLYPDDVPIHDHTGGSRAFCPTCTGL